MDSKGRSSSTFVILIFKLISQLRRAGGWHRRGRARGTRRARDGRTHRRRRRGGGSRRRPWVQLGEHLHGGSVEEAAGSGPGELEEAVHRPFWFVGSALAYHGLQHVVQDEGVVGVGNEQKPTSALAWHRHTPWLAVTD